ncbi:hypothetical protein ILUMI_24154 [Ignelater luminosus]|uniref:Uncharacterized protein n=1 Tax=Ignelater luminosus TaxID=2038154 RepID=A0A8K0CAR1_IGNLU|nr:hypothetical protein ILUMI_24154 [Ignelater luminosus]
MKETDKILGNSISEAILGNIRSGFQRIKIQSTNCWDDRELTKCTSPRRLCIHTEDDNPVLVLAEGKHVQSTEVTAGHSPSDTCSGLSELELTVFLDLEPTCLALVWRHKSAVKGCHIEKQIPNLERTTDKKRQKGRRAAVSKRSVGKISQRSKKEQCESDTVSECEQDTINSNLFDISDPGTWPNVLSNRPIETLVETGPVELAVEMVAKFDPVVSDHLNNIKNSKDRKTPYYLSKNIQDEIIELLAGEVEKEIVNLIQTSDTAATLAEEIDLEPEFPVARERKIKRQFLYESVRDSVSDPKVQFKINFYFSVLDYAEDSLEERFNLLSECDSLFDFRTGPNESTLETGTAIEELPELEIEQGPKPGEINLYNLLHNSKGFDKFKRVISRVTENIASLLGQLFEEVGVMKGGASNKHDHGQLTPAVNLLDDRHQISLSDEDGNPAFTLGRLSE